MISARVHDGLGHLVYGLGVVALALVAFASHDFDPGQAVPKDFPARPLLAFAFSTIMLVAGAAVIWRKTTAWGAAMLTAYYGLIVAVLMNGHVILRHSAEFGAYSGTAEQLAIASAALIVFAGSADIDARLAGRLADGARRVFGVCAVLFGIAHFVYPNLTAPLVPAWLPLSQSFWADATGVGQMAAGVALLTGVGASVAAVLLTAMYISFTALVHTPMLLANPWSRTNWGESALNFTLIGVAWVVADAVIHIKERGW